VATTEGIRRDIQGRITDPGKVFTVPNGVEDELYRKAAPYGVCSELRTALGEGFLAVYAGAHGVNNSLDLLIDAAELLREERRIRFVLVGSGSETPALVQRSQEKGLSNVVFTGAVPKSQVPSYLMCADVLLWPVLWDASRQSLRDLKEGACPNKVYDYLAAGKPVVATTPPASEGARLLEQFEAGIVVEPSASALCDALLELLEDEERRTSFGKRREEAIARFGRTRTGAVLERVISGASDQTPGSGNTGPKI